MTTENTKQVPPTGITMQKVDSSQIEEIGYLVEQQAMFIKFNSGTLYRYDNVTPELFQAFSTAPSVGSYFYRHIKPCADLYPFTKIPSVTSAPATPGSVNDKTN